MALLGRDGATLDEVGAGLPGPTLSVPADVTDAGAVEAAFSRIERDWGPVEVLVCNAGAGIAAPIVDTSDSDWARMLELNLTAPFRLMRRALPSMTGSGWGRIVVIASVVAKRGEAQVAAYTASKHGVLGLVRAAAAELARSGVTVNAVCPGYVDTPMTDATVEAIAARSGRGRDDARAALARRQPIGRLIEPDEVGRGRAILPGQRRGDRAGNQRRRRVGAVMIEDRSERQPARTGASSSDERSREEPGES